MEHDHAGSNRNRLDDLNRELEASRKKIVELEFAVAEEKRLSDLHDELNKSEEYHVELAHQLEAIDRAVTEEELIAILGVDKVDELKKNAEIAENERVATVAQKRLDQWAIEAAQERARPDYVEPSNATRTAEREKLIKRIRDKLANFRN